MISINRDTIATFAITELHFSNDLDDALDALLLNDFLDIAMTELRDADDLHNALNPLDDNNRATAIFDTIANEYDFIRTAMLDYINNR